MKKLIVLLAFFIVPSCLQSDSNLPKLANTYIKCLYPTIRVVTEHGTGSGVIIYSIKKNDTYDNIAITCAHVVDFENNPNIITFKYKNMCEFDSFEIHKSSIYYIDYNADIALLYFNTKDKLPTSHIKFNSNLHITDEVRAFGFGDSMKVARTDKGEITATDINFSNFKSSLYRTSIFTIPGDSGSGIFHNDNLVCIRAAILRGDEGSMFNNAFAVPIDVLLSINKELSGNLNFIWNKYHNKYHNNIDLEYFMLNLPEMEESKDANLPLSPETEQFDNFPPPAPS